MTAAPSLPALGWALLRLGAVAFGGLGAALALLQRELVDRRGWLAARDVSEALAFTKPLPGSTVVQVVAFLGWRLRGWPGALVATAAFLAPSVALMVAAAALSLALPDAPWVRGALTGAQVAVVGLLGAAMWRLARSEARGRALTLVLLASALAGLVVNAALVVIAAGVLGALIVGALAFGGGQAALPVVERLTVGDTGWLTPAQFAVGVGLAYATPGPVLILAAFVGYVVAGLPDALVATIAVFAVPVALAAGAAHVVARLSGSTRFRAFGRWAGAAAIGLLAVTLLALAQPLATSQPLLLAAAALVGLAAVRGVSPLALLGVAATPGRGEGTGPKDRAPVGRPDRSLIAHAFSHPPSSCSASWMASPIRGPPRGSGPA